LIGLSVIQLGTVMKEEYVSQL